MGKREPQIKEEITKCGAADRERNQITLYEKIFSKLHAIVFVFDLTSNRIVWASDGFSKILGYKKSTAAISEEELLEAHHPEDRDFLDTMRAFFRQDKKGIFTALIKFRTVNKDYVWLCSSIKLFKRTADEKVFEVVGVSLDLSQPFVYNKNVKAVSREKLREANTIEITAITRREKEILKYFANGYKTREISDKLGLSFHTVNNHRKNILKKLGMKNIAGLVNFAVENGLA